uniref:C2 domain-containing protein n=1 Tax=Steinernema glaseri TaxID=37863 RepID=A0A1I7YVL3_9BILA
MELYHMFLHIVLLVIIASLLFISIFRRLSRLESRQPSNDRVLEGYSEIGGTELAEKQAKHRPNPTAAPPTSDSDNMNTDSVTSMDVGSSEAETRELTRDEILHLKKLKMPEVRMALEFNKEEKKLNMYVKNVVKLPAFFFSPGTTCLISIIVIRNAARKWLGRRRSFDMSKIAPDNFTYLHTLAVPRNCSPVFNEFFSTDLTSSQYYSTMLKVQFRHKDRHDRETVIAEYDHWLDSHPIEKFTEFELPLFILNPDLGSIEFSLCYLPTAERISITIIRTIGLHVEGSSTNCIVKVALVIRERLRDRQKSKILQGSSTLLNQTMAFELPRKDISNAALIVSVYQISEVSMSKVEDDDGQPSTSQGTTQTRLRRIGRVALSASQNGEEQTHWNEAMGNPRKKITETHALKQL